MSSGSRRTFDALRNREGRATRPAAWRGRRNFRTQVELCDERGIRLLSDEVYRGVELDPARTLPQAADLSETVVSLNVMSKAYGLPGMRIGWLACRHRELLSRLERRKHYASICYAGPSEGWRRSRSGTARPCGRARGRHWRRTCPSSRRSSPSGPSCSSGSRPPAAASASRATSATRAWRRSAARSWRKAASSFSRPVFTSPLAEVPADRFRIGLGRRNPEPVLEAFGELLRGR